MSPIGKFGQRALRQRIRAIADFPEPGILFRDITPLLSDSSALALAADGLAEPFHSSGVAAVAGMEARGFILAPLVAERLGAGFVPLRKPGKLPYEVHGVSYDLEYGSARLEIHVDALSQGQPVLVVDDLIATGGTAQASCALIELAGGVVAGCAFLIELDSLNGRERLAPHAVHSLVHF